MYKDELEAITRSNRLRERKLFHADHIDLASNDYLKLSENQEILNTTIDELKSYRSVGSRASQLVNGYHEIHRNFELDLIRSNDFEAAITVGSGFLANLALFEALPRKGDAIFVDSEFHASGILATKTTQAKVIFFEHNNPSDLISKFDIKAKRKFIALEGIYSMSGNIVNLDLIKFAQENGVVFLDEAHSSGTIGSKLNGVLDHYNLSSKNIIKMGTLGKAYGSYGAYILASGEVIKFLENRAKPIIYSTALSLFDTLYAHNALKFINSNSLDLIKSIRSRIETANSFGYKTESLILNIPIGSDKKVLEIQQKLLNGNYLVGAIRKPTVKTAQLRVILKESSEILNQFFEELKRVL